MIADPMILLLALATAAGGGLAVGFLCRDAAREAEIASLKADLADAEAEISMCHDENLVLELELRAAGEERDLFRSLSELNWADVDWDAA